MQSGNTFHVGVGGIRFNETGSGTGPHVSFTGSGSKVPFLYDCYMQVKQRNGSSTSVAALSWTALGEVMWNSWLDGSAFALIQGASFAVMSPRAWTTASTFGDDDTNGNQNLYIENSTFWKVQQCPDCDDRGRVVFRHNTFDATTGLTHGLTSAWGGRQFEYYDNVFSNTPTGDASNLSGRYFWCRAGTGLFTDNVVNNSSNPGLYGSVDQVTGGDFDTPPGAYPINRQPGSSHNGTSYFQEGVYLWNQTGSRAYNWSITGPWSSHFQLGRDIFINTAKPGYAKYTYPHPFRSVVEG